MTDRELKTLKDNLWHAADVLRSGAHLAANKYGQPILGLIFLRYADILFKQHKDEIDAEYTKRLGTRMEKTSKEIAVEKCGFFLPECAYYDFINDAPDTAEKADLVKKAMEAIERENPKMEGVLPKEVYAQLVPEEEPELLSNIVRIFKDIPENCTVDIFGEIYEYFLGNFALAEGKDGGTFYTPATVVRYMVEVLDPQPGDKKFLDPACGSGGMFVQAARYMHAHNANEAEQMKFRCYGVEKEPDTVKLAKMNLLLNNVRGDITEANSFYSDPYNAFGAFDYVMANPSFPEYVKIGYANDIDKRLQQLNRSECIPFAFRVYATYEVNSRLSDLKIHSIIDKLNPNLRSIENFNGKQRVREFYAMSPEDAYSILEAIAEIHGCADKLKRIAMDEAQKKAEETAQEIDAEHKERQSPFRFSMCNIQPGEEIEYCNNPEIKCTVVDDKTVSYQGQSYSLSSLAQLLTGSKYSVAGPRYFKYKGEWLNDIRHRLEG